MSVSLKNRRFFQYCGHLRCLRLFYCDTIVTLYHDKVNRYFKLFEKIFFLLIY